jgi:hypothetical protein
MTPLGQFWGCLVLASLTMSVLPALSVPLPPTRPAEMSSGQDGNGLTIDGNPPITRDATPLPLCKGSDNRKWDNCVGTFTIDNLGEYSGEIRERKPNGTGVFRALDGSLYQGEFQNGVPSGKGRFTSSKGALYIGEFADGVANGEGSEKASDGTRYSGQYTNGVREGKGQLNYPDGRRYEGDFKADRFEGYGEFNFPNGDSYTGVFYNGEPTDRGIFRYANGDRYVGGFKDFQPSGPGVLTFVSGVKFIGGFIEGNPKGPGVLYDINGELVFEGEFSGFASIEKALADYQTKQKFERAVVNIVSPAPSALESNPSLQAGVAPLEKGVAAEAPALEQSEKDIKASSNELVVNTISIAPLKAETEADAITSPQPLIPDIDPVRKTTDMTAIPDQSVAVTIDSSALLTKAQSETPGSPLDLPRNTIPSEETAVVKEAASAPPLRCKRSGDLIVAFISCEVLSAQIEIDHITFPKTNCRSGQDYLADYDRDRKASWYDVIRLFKAYFYYRPFDYRGIHRYRDEVHFLVSRCARAGDFKIRIADVEWTWPENGEVFSSASP